MEAVNLRERQLNNNIEEYEEYKNTYRKKERRIIERLKLETECSIDISTDESVNIIQGKLINISPVGFSFKIEKSAESYEYEKINIDSFVKIIFSNGLNYLTSFGRVVWKKQISDTQINYGCQMPVFNKQIAEFIKQQRK